jgi:ankyrin repeat protein
MPQGFVEAVKAGDLAKVEEFLSVDPSLARAKNEGGTSIVLVAAYHNRPEIARLLAARTGTLNIFEAAAVGDLERVRELVQQDSELVNAYAADGFQPLGLASFFGHVELVRFLVSEGALVNSASENDMRVMPLHSAVAHRHLEIARVLLGQGADVNAPQRSGFTPLQGAVKNGQVEMTKLLLEHGADPDLQCTGGRTPREEAQSGNAPEIVGLLASRSR